MLFKDKYQVNFYLLLLSILFWQNLFSFYENCLILKLRPKALLAFLLRSPLVRMSGLIKHANEPLE